MKWDGLKLSDKQLRHFPPECLKWTIFKLFLNSLSVLLTTDRVICLRGSSHDIYVSVSTSAWETDVYKGSFHFLSPYLMFPYFSLKFKPCAEGDQMTEYSPCLSMDK